MKNKGMYAGIIILSIVILTSLLAPYIAPNDYLKVDLDIRLMPPNQEYIMGTDQLGRCIFSRIIYGSRVSLFTAAIITVSTFIIGTLLGIIAGIGGRLADNTISWLIEVVLAFPGIILALVIVGVLGPNIFNLTLALVLTSWAGYARVTRALVISVKQSDYCKAAIVFGTSKIKIITRHIIPNIISPLITMIICSVGGTILKIAGLSFIGLGAQPPTAEWGMMINDGRMYMQSAWWIILFPILAIFITVLGFNLFGDGIRNRLNPKGEM